MNDYNIWKLCYNNQYLKLLVTLVIGIYMYNQLSKHKINRLYKRCFRLLEEQIGT